MNVLSNSKFFKMRAWTVHLYTSLGLPAGLLALQAILQENARAAFIFLGIALFIDATDGTLARAWKVTTWTPSFDGRKLDDIIDYLTYAFLPIFMAYRFGLVTGSLGMLTLSIVLIAASYGFCNKAAKTTEGFFTGFPNFWNIVVFYLFLLRTPQVLNMIVLLILAALVFVPMEYVSFSARPFRKLTLSMAGLYGIALLFLLINFNEVMPPVVIPTLVFPAYYFILSIYMLIMRRIRSRSVTIEA
jgi:phosphatidylcholine synthase